MTTYANGILEELQENILEIINREREDVITECFKYLRHFSKKIMNDYCLMIDDRVFEFLEIEYYMLSDGLHDDPYIHKSDKQLSCGELYFHEIGRGGVDLTFGDKDKKFYGGILLKSMALFEDENNNTLIIGQTFVENAICNEIFDGNNIRKIEFNEKPERLKDHRDVCFSARVGLEKKDKTFDPAPYRFVRDDLYCEGDKYSKLSKNEKNRITMKDDLRHLRNIIDNNNIENIPEKTRKIIKDKYEYFIDNYQK